MYLLCCPVNQIPEMSQKFQLAKINSYPLGLIELVLDEGCFNWLYGNINTFDVVIFVSPSAIDFCSSMFALIKPNIEFLVMGRASAEKLHQLTKNKIRYSNDSSGASSLFFEIIKPDATLFRSKKILIVQGSGGQDMLNQYLQLEGMHSCVIKLYTHNPARLTPGTLTNLFAKNKFEGVIVTSSLLVNELFKQAKTDKCIEILKKTEFITIHSNIAQKLYEYGVANVLVTPGVKKSDLIGLLKRDNKK